MAPGFTINHVAAVFLPALGGFCRMIDDRIPFVVVGALGAEFRVREYQETVQTGSVADERDDRNEDDE